MISYDFWLAELILLIGIFFLIAVSFRFFRSERTGDKMVAGGLVCISIALFLNAVFYALYLFVEFYWIFVEIFHILGIILITYGILGDYENVETKVVGNKNEKFR